jgi:hypothetical protein
MFEDKWLNKVTYASWASPRLLHYDMPDIFWVIKKWIIRWEVYAAFIPDTTKQMDFDLKVTYKAFLLHWKVISQWLKSKEMNAVWEVSTNSIRQEFPRLLWNTNFRYGVYLSSLLSQCWVRRIHSNWRSRISQTCAWSLTSYVDITLCCPANRY